MTNTEYLQSQLTVLAQELAKATLRYYELKVHVDASKHDHGSALREDESALRRATDEMVDAQNNMALCAERLATVTY